MVLVFILTPFATTPQQVHSQGRGNVSNPCEATASVIQAERERASRESGVRSPEGKGGGKGSTLHKHTLTWAALFAAPPPTNNTRPQISTLLHTQRTARGLGGIPRVNDHCQSRGFCAHSPCSPTPNRVGRQIRFVGTNLVAADVALLSSRSGISTVALRTAKFGHLLHLGQRSADRQSRWGGIS